MRLSIEARDNRAVGRAERAARRKDGPARMEHFDGQGRGSSVTIFCKKSLYHCCNNSQRFVSSMVFLSDACNLLNYHQAVMLPVATTMVVSFTSRRPDTRAIQI